MSTCNSWQMNALTVHNNKYDYSLINYQNMKTKVIIICPVHGQFLQTLSSHIYSKAGCPKCGNINKKIKNFAEKENVLQQLNDLYDYKYPTFEYSGQQSKINFICSIHGLQNQKLNNLLQGHGCNKCANEIKSKNMIITSAEIIKRCCNEHDYKYKYPDKNYVLKNYGNIICPVHGQFKQNMNNHVNGQGCPKCKESKGEKYIRKYLEESNIFYLQEHIFNDLKKRFDFYLPDYNICIEFDGIQHFEAVEFFGGEDNLNYVKQSDNKKNGYCFKNNIKLIRINYKQINNIKEILDEYTKFM